ncbi:hypothetical protein DPMN_119488 [Dreissena polymorpha]|uniref:Uncharacterized protein n=1 Tax=Dreissena polymorpha TaxID=45954 RepID=A0A9D4GJD2_DREPO|nr:hypothetical protein DPMN_119488 [Dreissena polymorpha]
MSSVRILVVFLVVCVLAGSLVQQAEATEACDCKFFCGRKECQVGRCGRWGWRRTCCPNTSPRCHE